MNTQEPVGDPQETPATTQWTPRLTFFRDGATIAGMDDPPFSFAAIEESPTMRDYNSRITDELISRANAAPKLLAQRDELVEALKLSQALLTDSSYGKSHQDNLFSGRLQDRIEANHIILAFMCGERG